MKLKYAIILVIFFISLIVSGILSFIPLEQACGITPGNSCYAVQTSKYESAFGIKNSYLGLMAFSVLTVLTIFQLKKPTKSKKAIIALGIIIASIISVYFIYLQFYVIKAVCKYCMVVDVGSILNLGILIFANKK